jgi:hypothetical protein
MEQWHMEKADPALSANDDIKWRASSLAIAEVRGKFADLPAEEVEPLINEAIAETRRSNP